MANPLPFLRGLFLAGTSIFGKVGFFLVGTKFGRRGFIIALILITILSDPIKQSVDEKTPRPVIDAIVSRLASGDNGINQEINDFKALPKKTIWKTLVSAFKLFGFFYFSFLLIGWFFWKIADFQDDTHDLRNAIFTIVMVLSLQVGGSIYLLSTEHEGSLSQDLSYIIGDKSLIETILFLNPVKGLINLVTSLDDYLQPIINIMQRFIE